MAERSPLILAPPRGGLAFRLMGILNVTPDSFHAASRASGVEEAVRRGLELAREGAEIIDVGGESTRPGAQPVPEAEELRRVLPVIERLARESGALVSVDTGKPGVARRAREAGATMLNDVLGLRAPGMLQAAADYPEVVLMHMQGEPRTMQKAPRYGDVVKDIMEFLGERLQALTRSGLDPDRVYIDPGIGFGKTTEHTLEILRRLEEFHALGLPLALGASRKSFIGRLLGSEEDPVPAQERLEGSIAAACRALQAGVSIIRVHDVAATKRALTVFGAVMRGEMVPPAARPPAGGTSQLGAR